MKVDYFHLPVLEWSYPGPVPTQARYLPVVEKNSLAFWGIEAKYVRNAPVVVEFLTRALLINDTFLFHFEFMTRLSVVNDLIKRHSYR